MGHGWSTVSYNMSTTSSSTSATSSTGAPPAPTQSGIVAHCLEWYVAQTNDSCTAIASAYSITLAQFNAWNPAVGGKYSRIILYPCRLHKYLVLTQNHRKLRRPLGR